MHIVTLTTSKHIQQNANDFQHEYRPSCKWLPKYLIVHTIFKSLSLFNMSTSTLVIQAWRIITQA